MYVDYLPPTFCGKTQADDLRFFIRASCLGGASSPSIFRVRLPEPGSEDRVASGMGLPIVLV